MKKRISAKLAGNLLLAALGLLTIFHVLVLLRVIPADIVWSDNPYHWPVQFLLDSELNWMDGRTPVDDL